MSSTWINGRRYEIGSRAYYDAMWREEQRQRDEQRRRREEQRLERERQRLQREADRLERERRLREEEQRRREEAERRRREEEQQRQRIAQAWEQAQNSLLRDAEDIQNSPERNELSTAVKNLKSSFISNMTNYNTASAEKIIADMRKKIISVQADEKFLASQKNNLLKNLSSLEKISSAGFKSEIESIRQSSTKKFNASINEQTRQIKNLMSQAGKLAEEIEKANAISLEGFKEEMIFIPPALDEDKKAKDELTAIINDICDFGERIAFFDKKEAEQVKPLILEAKQEKSQARLNLIRTQIKITYGKLKEAAVLTSMFKHDFKEFLPLMQRADGAANLCLRMEDLLTAQEISRDQYNEIYKAVKEIYLEQAEAVEEKFFAEKVAKTLGDMGYSLLDESGAPVENISTGKMNLLNTPYEGYKARITVSHDGKISTRLVRVVGSEAEKNSVSEYQRQVDIETGKKWCKNLEDFYKKLEAEGIIMGNTILRKEPEQEILDVIVDESIQRRKAQQASAEAEQEFLHERNL